MIFTLKSGQTNLEMSIANFIRCAAVIVIASACGVIKPRTITVVQHDTTTVYKNNSTVEKDSIIVWKDKFVYTKGDTVYSTTVEYKDKWRIKEVKDTVYKDKVRIEYKEVPVVVEKQLTKIQKLLITFGKLFGVLLIGLVALLIVKHFKF